MPESQIGDEVKRQRSARGWTQEQLAEVARIGLRTIQRLETRGVAALSTLRQVAEAFDMTVDELQRLKPASEPKQTLPAKHKVEILPRLQTGNDVTAILSAAEMHQYDHDTLADQGEVNLVSAFLQNLEDWGDVWDALSSGDRVSATFGLQQELAELEASGFLAFGALVRRKVKFPLMAEPNVLSMAISVVVVFRVDNPRIVRAEGIECLPVLL